MSGEEDGEERELLSADPTYGVIAKKPKDFHIFINLVDFCQDVLLTQHCQLFSDWVMTLTHALVVMSTQHPLVSGFYKLLSITMTLAGRLNYFKPLMKDQNADLARHEESMDCESQESGSQEFATKSGHYEVETTFQLIKKFSKEVLVRMKQYRDDLLASCLTLILTLPKEVLIDQMSAVVPAIQTTLTLGLSYLPLAEVGLTALETWAGQLPVAALQPLYRF